VERQPIGCRNGQVMLKQVAQPVELGTVRKDFPILEQQVNGYPLAYLDSAATSQKPAVVIDALDDYYRRYNANVHRGVYQISEQATEAMEGARAKIQSFIGAKSPREIIFTRNTTESINLVAQSWGRTNLRRGDRILLTEMEHHANLVPWQLIAAATGAELDFIPLDGRGRLALDDLSTRLLNGTKLVAITQMSNVLGTINPVREIAMEAHRHGAVVLVDGAQGVSHLPVNVEDLQCDFLAFSGHKMCGPTGIGVLWGRRELLQAMPPFLGGGGMIEEVTLRRSTWAEIPAKFEAGTPAIGEAIALGVAVDYLRRIDMGRIHAHEQALIANVLDILDGIDGLTVYGPPAADRGGIVSFNLEEIHGHDVAALLDQRGIAVRAGHHCCQPLMSALGAPASVRASFYLYSTAEEIERLGAALEECKAFYA
jgi:cysteine desulfurase/selenocysteine lyase